MAKGGIIDMICITEWRVTVALHCLIADQPPVNAALIVYVLESIFEQHIGQHAGLTRFVSFGCRRHPASSDVWKHAIGWLLKGGRVVGGGKAVENACELHTNN